MDESALSGAPGPVGVVVAGSTRPDSRKFVLPTIVPDARGGGVTGAPRGRYVDLVQVVARSQIPVIASPTYKASYTGRLKAFLDRYGDGGLGSCIAVPLMTGGSRDHSLAVDLLLRPLLVELGAAGRGWGDASPVVVGFRA